MYVNYYTREMMNEGDNPPIGIVLCADKSDQIVKYTLPEENNQITVTTELLVAFYDYITKDHQIVRGSKTKKIYIHYELAYVCNKTTPDICPNCGAKLTDKASQRCDYCGSMIAQVSKDWVLSKKEAKEQH